MNTTVLIIVCGLAGFALLLLLGFALRHAAPPNMTLAVEDDTDDAQIPAPTVGRHHHDTVEIVLPGYMPPIGRRRIAEDTNTQRIDWPRS